MMAVALQTRPDPTEMSSTCSAFTGVSLHQESRCKVDDVITRNMIFRAKKGQLVFISTLKFQWFRRNPRYLVKHRKVLRNRNYNLWWKHKYKRGMWRVLRRVKDYMADDNQKFDSVEEVTSILKPTLDAAFLCLEKCVIQGVLKKGTAANRKSKMLKLIIRLCRGKGILTLTEEERKFTAPHKILGYEPPECLDLREPRPWQLPGWKSPWTLKTEYAKWLKKSGRAGAKKKEEA